MSEFLADNYEFLGSSLFKEIYSIHMKIIISKSVDRAMVDFGYRIKKIKKIGDM